MADISIPPISPATGGQQTAIKVRADRRSGNAILETEGRRYTLSRDELKALDDQVDAAMRILGVEDDDESEGEDDQAASDAEDHKNMLAIMISPRMKRGE